MLRKWAAVLLLFLLLEESVIADTHYSGYLKSYALWQDETTLRTEELWQWQNSARFMASYFFTEASNIELQYEYTPIYVSQAGALSQNNAALSTVGILNNRYRYKDISNDYGSDNSHWVQLHNVDRLNYRYSNEYGDLTVGRQVVSFGSARFINPTDIFLPYTLQTLNQEYRVGIDAIRYQWALGDFSVLDMGLVIGEDARKENNALFVRARNNVAESDIEAVLILQDQSYLIGGGLERAVGDFGFWFETAFVHSEVTDLPDTVSYWRHSIGMDYAFTDTVITMLEYHFNGAGSDSTEDYITLLQLQAYQKGGVYLLGQHYLIPSVSWMISPLVNFSGSGFFNLSDHSQFINLVFDVSWSDNLYSDFGLYLTQGDKLKGDIDSPLTWQLGSEFGEYPVSIYASLRWYF